MTNAHTPRADRRVNFLVTGVYKAEERIPSSVMSSRVQKAIEDEFGVALSVLTYTTPHFDHPHAIDLRSVWMSLTDDQRANIKQISPEFNRAVQLLFNITEQVMVDDERRQEVS
jgi:hypothetical protein